MYLIVGLGNPEAEYARTRHNMGVDVVNELADKYRELSKKEENVIFGGRLAEYKYYDMDDVIKSAFNSYEGSK